MKAIAVIPARYMSTRLPGKPLIDLEGKSMIRRVYERVSEAIETVIVATDDQRIVDEVRRFGGKVYLTDPNHNTGTNRCLEAYKMWSGEERRSVDVILNVQGDEPLLNPDHLENLLGIFNRPECTMGTLVVPLRGVEAGSSHVYAVLNNKKQALYFSRYPIPFVQNGDDQLTTRYKHYGIYAFRPDSLVKFASMDRSSLENSESLEQLRWLESGHEIQCVVVQGNAVSVDTPEDAEMVREILRSENRA